MKTKQRLILLAALGFLFPHIAVSYEFPRSTFPIEELDKAKEKAIKGNKPIVFIVVNRK